MWVQWHFGSCFRWHYFWQLNCHPDLRSTQKHRCFWANCLMSSLIISNDDRSTQKHLESQVLLVLLPITVYKHDICSLSLFTFIHPYNNTSRFSTIKVIAQSFFVYLHFLRLLFNESWTCIFVCLSFSFLALLASSNNNYST